MAFCPEDDGIENANNDNGDRQSFIPMVTNGSMNVLNIFKHIINDCNDNYVKSNDY